jgi:thiamine-phosphate pyrophosphorylase
MTTNDRQIALRMADANLNRVMEGLRTLEDIARFSDLASLQSRYKSLRHCLQQVLSTWDQSALLAARDAEHDVGRTEKQAAELSREDGLLDIAASAAGRCEQGLRVLEESAKFLFPATATAIESIRYRVYDLDAELQLALQRDLAFLDRSQLYVLVDCQLPLARFVQRIEAISNAGVDLIQIRDKAAQAVTQIQYADAAVNALDPNITRIIINDRIDIASCCKAWGCHVGQEDLPPVIARGILRGEQILGVSTHDLRQIQKAVDDRADYVGCGPTFPSKTKSFDQFAGLPFLEQATQYLIKSELKLPAFAIGGIHPENLHQVLDAGFDRIAVSSCVWNSNDPAGVSEQLKKRLLAKRGGRTA